MVQNSPSQSKNETSPVKKSTIHLSKAVIKPSSTSSPANNGTKQSFTQVDSSSAEKAKLSEKELASKIAHKVEKKMAKK